MEKILDRFLRYVAVDTQSDPTSESQPSAAKELDLLKMLKDELVAMGVEATLDEYGYVMASIPSNCGKDAPSCPSLQVFRVSTARSTRLQRLTVSATVGRSSGMSRCLP